MSLATVRALLRAGFVCCTNHYRHAAYMFPLLETANGNVQRNTQRHGVPAGHGVPATRSAKPCRRYSYTQLVVSTTMHKT